MFETLSFPAPPQLLVSVRNVEEALEALAGGAQIIDVKEPDRGSLGAADYETVAAIVERIAGRLPVTMALGELDDLLATPNRLTEGILIPTGVELFKIGLAQIVQHSNWRDCWLSAAGHLRGEARPVAVAYADWKVANAPSPWEVLDLAVAGRFPALLIDTWNKQGGSLFDVWDLAELQQFCSQVHENGIALVLAGSLDQRSLAAALALHPVVVAVRGAACVDRREGAISVDRVATLRRLLDTGIEQSVGAVEGVSQDK